jgi:glucose-6-phosphate-specific signal transduction histidine kinase
MKKKQKSKIVLFRLTQEDFNKFEDFCENQQVKISCWLRDQVQKKIAKLPRKIKKL